MPELKTLDSYLGEDDSFDTVRKNYSVGIENLKRVHRGQWNQPRDVAI